MSHIIPESKTDKISFLHFSFSFFFFGRGGGGGGGGRGGAFQLLLFPSPKLAKYQIPMVLADESGR